MTITFHQKRELIELTLLEKHARVRQMQEGVSSKRFDQIAVDLQAGRIPILEAILADYERACSRKAEA